MTGCGLRKALNVGPHHSDHCGAPSHTNYPHRTGRAARRASIKFRIRVSLVDTLVRHADGGRSLLGGHGSRCHAAWFEALAKIFVEATPRFCRFPPGNEAHLHAFATN